MKIELNGEYVTESGVEHRIHVVDAYYSEAFPVRGEVKHPLQGWLPMGWSTEGRACVNSDRGYDLVPKPRKWHQFVNILAVRGDIGVPRDTKRDCDLRLPDGERAGLIRLDYDGKKLIGVTVLEPSFDIPEGEGLSAAEAGRSQTTNQEK